MDSDLMLLLPSKQKLFYNSILLAPVCYYFFKSNVKSHLYFIAKNLLTGFFYLGFYTQMCLS